MRGTSLIERGPVELDEDATLAHSEWTYLDEQYLIDKHSDWTKSRRLVNRLSSITDGATTTNYTYDIDGDTLTYGTNTLTWNGHGQIATDAPTTSSSVAYTYDPLGRLQERATTGPTTDSEYIYAGTSDNPMMITDGAGTITQSYVGGPLGTRRINNGPPLIGGVDNGNGELLFTDGIGNTAGTIDFDGNRTNTYTYDPFGTSDQPPPTNTLTNRFLGKNERPLDTQTGLILMGARPYDAGTGRFLSVDPVDGGSANVYDYANQDPLDQDDPSGDGAITGGGLLTIDPAKAVIAVVSFFATLCASNPACRPSIGFHPGHSSAGPKTATITPVILTDGQFAGRFGYTAREVKKAIGRAKHPNRNQVAGSASNNNANVGIDENTGELYPEVPGGKYSEDSVGNIYEDGGLPERN